MEEEEKKARLCFSAFSLVGPKRFRLLLNFFGSAAAAWQGSESKWKEIGLPEKLVEKFFDFRQNFDYSSYLLRLRKGQVRPLYFDDKNYPESLIRIDGAPFLLYTIGEILPEDCLAISVVGTRRVTGYGQEVTERLVTSLVASKMTIVSGLAYGVDLVAHKTALSTGGRTIGVWAGGLDTVEAGFRHTLVEQIVKGKGAIVSEFPLGFHPNRTTFPQRNRIISGLSLGVLVTEAAEDSGSLITAEYARKQGRPVFAVPGPITSVLSKGTATLIKEGAKLVYDTDDILGELDVKSKIKYQKSKMILPENKDEKIILDLLENESKNIDEIARETGMEIAKVSGLLTLMEMKGMVKSRDGEYGI
ncbi:MAG: DNA-processing protein DprA [bacterium]|nr:DNA-processing protein DprA [bacterium]